MTMKAMFRSGGHVTMRRPQLGVCIDVNPVVFIYLFFIFVFFKFVF